MQVTSDGAQLDLLPRAQCDKLEGANVAAYEYVNEASFLRFLSLRNYLLHKKGSQPVRCAGNAALRPGHCPSFISVLAICFSLKPH